MRTGREGLELFQLSQDSFFHSILIFAIRSCLFIQRNSALSRAEL